MTVSSPLVRARGQIMFSIGLVLALSGVIAVERMQFVPVSDLPPVPELVRPLAADARQEWAFIERNFNPASGLVSLHDGSGTSSAAGAGHALMAMIAAHRLSLISGRELYQRVATLLKTLKAIPPEAAGMRLDTRTGKATGEASEESPAPLISALQLVAWSYPANSVEAAALLEQWRSRGVTPGVGHAPSELETAADALTRAAIVQKGVRQ